MKIAIKRGKVGTLNFLIFLYLAMYFGHNTGIGIQEMINKGAFLILCAYMFLLALHKIGTVNRKYQYLLWFMCFLVYGLISWFWAISPSSVFITITVYIQIVVVLLAITWSVKCWDDVELMMKVFIFAVLYSLIILFLKQPNVLNWFPSGGLNANGWHRNSYSIILYFAAMMSFYFAKNKIECRRFYGILTVIFSITVLPCTSRKVIMMLIIGIALYIIVSSKNSFGLLKNLGVACMILVATVILILNNNTLYNLIGFRFVELLNYFTGSGYVDFSTMERVYLISLAKQIFCEHPILGIGLDNYSYMLGLTYGKSVYSHCTYWEILSSLGLIGFLIYYSWLGTMLIQTIKKIKIDKPFFSWAFTMLLVNLVFDYTCISYNTVYTHVLYVIIFLALYYAGQRCEN